MQTPLEILKESEFKNVFDILSDIVNEKGDKSAKEYLDSVLVELTIKLLEDMKLRLVRKFDAMIQPQDSYDLGIANTLNEEIEYLEAQLNVIKNE